MKIKHCLLFSLLFISNILIGQTVYTSIQDGSYRNNNTWSTDGGVTACTCQPPTSINFGDSIVIQHDVFLSGRDLDIINGSVTIDNGIFTTNNRPIYVAPGQQFIAIQSLVDVGDDFINAGTFTNKLSCIEVDGTYQNQANSFLNGHGALNVTGDIIHDATAYWSPPMFWCSGAFSNAPPASGDCAMTAEICNGSAYDANLSVNLTAPNQACQYGDIYFFIDIDNNGPDTAYGVFIENFIPEGVALYEYTIDAGATWIPWNGDFFIDKMANGDVVNLIVHGIVNAPTTPSIVENTATIGTASEDADLSDNMDNATSVIPLFIDYDGDNVASECDLDDDNDGIPDIVENSITVVEPIPSCETDPVFDFSSIPTLVAGVDLQEGAVYRFSNVRAGIDALVTIEDLVNLTIPLLDDNGTNPMWFNPQSAATIADSGNYAYQQYLFQFVTSGTATAITIPASNLTFNDVDGNTSYGEQSWAQTPTSYTADNPTDLSFQYNEYVVGTAGLTEYSGVTGNFPQANYYARYENTSQFRVRFGVQARTDNVSTSGRQHSLSFTCPGNFVNPYTVSADKDRDGIPNYLDLDSDNDGILDAYEAGHGLPVGADGRISGASAGSGFNGLFDGVETSSDSDTIGYIVSDSETVQDTIYDAYELDSDADGCYDSNEEDISDSDNDGIAGSGVPPVDSNGLVTSITYAAPANNSWQDPLDVECDPCTDTDLPDSDGDGINDVCDLDDDNDGIPDEDECFNPTQRFDGLVVPDAFYHTGNAANSPVILDSIEINGVVYKDFTLPDSYNHDFSGNPAIDPNDIVIYDNGTLVAEYTASPDWNVDALPTFLNLNMNHYQYINGHDMLDGFDYFQVGYPTPIEVNEELFITVSERTGNNSVQVQAFDLLQAPLGPRFDVDFTEYEDSGVNIDPGNQDLEYFTIPLDDLAPYGSSISYIRIFDNHAVSDAADLKMIIFGEIAKACADSDNDGIPNSLDLDSDNDGILDAYEAGHGLAVAADGRIAGAQAGSGSNGLYDGVETSPDSDSIAYVISDSEITQDQMYDAYELDSDDDGCYDTTEEGVSDSDNDGTAGAGVPAVDTTNGLVSSITYIAPSNNTWQDYIYVATECDTDDDNINPVVDLDDDNDGIKDTDEGHICETLDISSLDGMINSLADFNAAQLNISGATIQINDPLTFGGSATIDEFGVNDNHETGSFGFQLGVNSSNAADYLEANYTFSEDVCDFNARILDIDVSDALDIYGYLDGVSVTYTVPYQGACVDYNASNTFSSSCLINANPGAGNVDQHAINIAFNSCIDSMVIRIYENGAGSGGSYTFVLSPDPTCTYRDTDNDGVSDYLDLDSDNDGIFDLDESGHLGVDANEDGIIDGLPSTFGTNGLHDTVETAPDNGNINYTISDSEGAPDGIYDPYELDSDGDTCFDSFEEDVVDGDIDGIAGSGVPTVDSNGLVIGNTYIAPPNNAWQDPSIFDCIPSFVCNSNIYIASSTGSANPSQLSSIDISTSPYTLNPIGPGTGSNYNAMGYRSQDNYIYGIKLMTNELIRIDSNGVEYNLGPITGLPVPSSTSDSYDSGDVFPDGNLYIHEVSTHDEMYQIDVTSTPPSLIQTNILSQGIWLSDFAYNIVDDKVYGVGDGGQKYMIDPATWTVSTIGTNAPAASYGAAYTNSIGQVFVYRNNPGALFLIDFGLNGTGTGDMTLLSTAPNVSFNDGASCRGDFTVPEICNSGADEDGDGLVDCFDPDCDQITLSNTVGPCIDHPLEDIAELTVSVSWATELSDTLEVEVLGSSHLILMDTATSPTSIVFNVPADGSIDNIITASWGYYTTGCTEIDSFDAPIACSNDTIACNILYFCGDEKPSDGDAWDHGWIEYLDANNGASIVNAVFTKDESGQGTYDPADETTFINIDYSLYDLIIVSATTEDHMSSDLVDVLKGLSQSIVLANFQEVQAFDLSNSAGFYEFDDDLHIDNVSSIPIYNYRNSLQSLYNNVFTHLDYRSDASAYLWNVAGAQAAENQGVYVHYESSDVFPVVGSHGPRTYFGFHMNELYSNQRNGGPSPVSMEYWFHPTKDLTTEGKLYFDQMLIEAASQCGISCQKATTNPHIMYYRASR